MLQNWSLISSHEKPVSVQTIRRTIKKQGLNGREARKKPFINMRNRKLRREFAVNHIKKDESWWNDVIFLDVRR